MKQILMVPPAPAPDTSGGSYRAVRTDVVHDSHLEKREWPGLRSRRGAGRVALLDEFVARYGAGPMDVLFEVSEDSCSLYPKDDGGSEKRRRYCLLFILADALVERDHDTIAWFTKQGVDPALACASIIDRCHQGKETRTSLRELGDRYPSLAGIERLSITAIADALEAPADLSQPGTCIAGLIPAVVRQQHDRDKRLHLVRAMLLSNIPMVANTNESWTAADILINVLLSAARNVLKKTYLKNAEIKNANTLLQECCSRGLLPAQHILNATCRIDELVDCDIVTEATLRALENVGRDVRRRVLSPNSLLSLTDTGAMQAFTDNDVNCFIQNLRGGSTDDPLEAVQWIVRNLPHATVDGEAALSTFQWLVEGFKKHEAARLWSRTVTGSDLGFMPRIRSDSLSDSISLQAAFDEMRKGEIRWDYGCYRVLVSDVVEIAQYITSMERLTAVMKIIPDMTSVLQHISQPELRMAAMDAMVRD